jgi:hypothetical protein
MSTALLYKEFRETLPIAVVGLACLLIVALDPMGYAPIPYLLNGNAQGAIPFMEWGDSFAGNFRMVAGAFALALGFWHALGDFWGEAHLFLLHRPVERKSIYVTKLVIGLVTYVLCGAAPIVLYACWAATPGTHASPFEWEMTRPVVGAWLAMITVYLGAFLAGLRPGAWVGTRLAPVAGAIGLIFVVEALAWLPGALPVVLGPSLLGGADVAFITAILYTAQSRDFG